MSTEPNATNGWNIWDAVLELAMSRYLYDKLHLDEGVLSKTRAKAVCEEALNVYADKIDLSAYLLLETERNTVAEDNVRLLLPMRLKPCWGLCFGFRF